MIPSGTLRQRFSALVDASYDDVYSYASYLSGGAAETEDIVHEAFLAAFDRLSGGREFEGDPHMWLRGTVRNLVHVFWRKKRKLAPELADRLLELADEADDAGTAAARRESCQALRRCLETLSAEERRLVTGRYEDDLAITELAARLNLNVATARVRLFRIREALRACVARRLGEVT